MKTYRITILPVALYECETQSLTLKKTENEVVSELGAEENIWT
jgi:hypothetical protein